MPLRRFTGTLTKFYHDRGFGFVKIDGPYRDAMVNIAQFGRHVGTHELGPGVRIEFYLEAHTQGLRAVRANII
jgi:cold shock CspA family protein